MAWYAGRTSEAMEIEQVSCSSVNSIQYRGESGEGVQSVQEPSATRELLNKIAETSGEKCKEHYNITRGIICSWGFPGQQAATALLFRLFSLKLD